MCVFFFSKSIQFQVVAAALEHKLRAVEKRGAADLRRGNCVTASDLHRAGHGFPQSRSRRRRSDGPRTGVSFEFGD